MLKSVLTIATVATLAAGGAFAGNGNGNGNGNGHGNNGSHSANASGIHCPPGLANRDPACVPPGQAKKGVTTEEWTGYEVGDHIDRDDFTWIDVENYDLPELEPGERYAIVDDQVIIIDPTTYTVVALLDVLANLEAAN